MRNVARHFTKFFGIFSGAGKGPVAANLPHADERLGERPDWRGEILVPPRMAAVPGMQARVSGRAATSLRDGTEGWIAPDGSFRRRVRVTRPSVQCAARAFAPQIVSASFAALLMSLSRQSGTCAARKRRLRIEILSSMRRTMLRTSRRTPARFSDPRPVRFRSSSSRIWRSRTQCRLFSIAQRFRMAVKTSYGGFGIYVGLGPTSKVRFLLGFGGKTESFAKRLTPDVTKCWYLQQISDVLLHEPIRSNHSARPCRESDREARNHALVRP